MYLIDAKNHVIPFFLTLNSPPQIRKMEYQPAKTIDEVIQRLEEVIDCAIETKSANGIFAALYIVVTEKIRDGILKGDIFEDNPRMERFDVIFANRYLKAIWEHQNGLNSPHACKVAFIVADRFPTKTILQELLVSMNAHINLDLGIAAAETSPGDAIDSLKNDFDSINTILGSLVDEIKEDISKMSPRFGLIIRFMVAEDAIMNFSIKVARKKAWKFAKQLAPRSGAAFEAIVNQKDLETAKLGRLVASPGWWANLINWWVKRAESQDLPAIIREMRGAASARVRFPAEVRSNDELAEEKPTGDNGAATA